MVKERQGEEGGQLPTAVPLKDTFKDKLLQQSDEEDYEQVEPEEG